MSLRSMSRRATALAGLFALMLVAGAWAQQVAEEPTKPKAKTEEGAPAKEKARGGNPAAAFAGVLEAIKNTPGCFGIETAQTSSGKQVVFAWFKDREAVLDWYYSDEHQKLMSMMGDGSKNSDPLEGVAEGEGPLMCVAAVTWAKSNGQPKPAEGSAGYQPQIPISQISVEVFKPVTAAKAFNGSFSPAEALLPKPEAAAAAAP